MKYLSLIFLILACASAPQVEPHDPEYVASYNDARELCLLEFQVDPPEIPQGEYLEKCLAVYGYGKLPPNEVRAIYQ